MNNAGVVTDVTDVTKEQRRARDHEVFRLLCVGDIHLGRRPGRVAELLGDDSELQISELGSDAAWRLTVNWALDNDVDAVVLAGDVVESLDDRFKAYGYLEKGVRDLNAAGIAVVGVAGNHDGVALPRLASRLEGFHLLGKGSKWEALELAKAPRGAADEAAAEATDGAAAETTGEATDEATAEAAAEAATATVAPGRRLRLRLLGWSFQGRRARINPVSSLLESPDLPVSKVIDLATFSTATSSAEQPEQPEQPKLPEPPEPPEPPERPETTEAAATIGVLHCDLDSRKSDYAPVSREDLRAAPGDAWILGHIHKPGDLSGTRPLGYLGSLVGLDAGEPGRHGPWLARVSGHGAVDMEQIPLAPIRWEEVDLDISAIGVSATRDDGEDPPAETVDIEDEIAAAVTSALNSVHESLAAECYRPRAVACRIRLCGQGPAYSALRACLEAGRDSAAADALYQQLRRDETTYFVEKVIDAARPSLDLESIAAGSDPPALLARRLLALQQGGAAAERLIEQSASYTDKAVSFLRELGGPGDEFDVSPGRERLLRAGLALLDELLSQKDSDRERAS